MAAVKEYHLTIDEQLVNVTGKPLKRITVNGKFPAPLLEFEEGDEAVIHVYNKLKNEDSSLHWHGLLLPALMDGVPALMDFRVLNRVVILNTVSKFVRMELIGTMHTVRDRSRMAYMGHL